MAPNEVRTRTAVSRIDADGIFHVTALPGVEETLADAQESFRANAVFRTGRSLPTLIDLRGVKSQSRDVRQFYSSPEVTQTISARALLVSSRVSMLMANFLMTISRVSLPTRVFTDEAEAIEWLKGFVSRAEV
jgi:hypothetical protein